MLPSLEGQRVPDAHFLQRKDGVSVDLSTAEVFSAKTVVAFGLPGAFTPTCSSSHVPRYNELAPSFKKVGVDRIVCISVNDPFVMDAWRADSKADSLLFLADGNGAFTDAMGMLVDKSATGMGKRSQRYSMLVRDGVIERMFIEAEGAGDPFDVADADTMLAHLGGSAPQDILLFTKPGCSHCVRARALLTARGLPWAELGTSPRILRALPGAHTTPQVFIDGLHIGGTDELAEWLVPVSIAPISEVAEDHGWTGSIFGHR